MRLDVGKPHLDVGNAVRVGGGFGFRRERRQFLVTRHHSVEQAFGSARRFLRHGADAGIARQRHRARFQLKVAEDQPEQRRLADAIAAHDADLVAFGHGDGCLVQQKPAADPIGQSIDMQHDDRASSCGAVSCHPEALSSKTVLTKLVLHRTNREGN